MPGYQVKRVLGLVLLAVSAGQVWSTQQDPCTLPKEEGSCRAHVEAFYFNVQSQRCEGFIYGGCNGNANRFSGLEACHEACQHHLGDPEETDVSVHLRGSHCLEPPVNDEGATCYGYFPRFTFNPDTLRCEAYVYGGCKGTSNLYLSQDECVSSCLYGDFGSRPSSSKGPAAARGGSAAASAGKKKKPKNRGRIIDKEDDDEEDHDEVVSSQTADASGGNTRALSDVMLSPTLKSDEHMAAEDICSLPPVHPHLVACLTFSEKWTFDPRQQTCVEFIYGGCFGTQNLFDTKLGCEEACANRQSSGATKKIDVCGLPLTSGPCRGRALKYGFNQNTNRCENFIYGGCKGNANRFDSLEECVNTCGGQDPQEQLSCLGARCSRQEAAFYRSKGCLPVVKSGECCPSSWDCSAWDERMRRWDECFVANDKFPRGKYHAVGERVPEAEQGCRMLCTCSEGSDEEAEIVCATADCGIPQGDFNQGQHCVALYPDKDACCPTQIKCDDELKALPTCTMDNSTFVAGQKMTTKSDPCKVCYCSEAWDGDLENSQLCYTEDCAIYLHYSQKLKQGCAPVYRDDVCCPVDVVCPPEANDTAVAPPVIEVNAAHLSVACPTPGQAVSGHDLVAVVRDQQAVRSDVCLLPRQLGGCPAFRDAWYFDTDARKCFPFKTGVLEQELLQVNAFVTEADCKATCAQFMPQADGCEMPSESHCHPDRVRYRFNSESGKCDEFYTSLSECRGFRTIDECEARCTANSQHQKPEIAGRSEECNLPVEVGPCRSHILRFYYDRQSGLCKKFFYGGCSGNSNNFHSLHSCLERCVSQEKMSRAVVSQSLTILDPCHQPQAVMGPCRASIPRFSFDPQSRTCRSFIYGGCLGNENNFVSLSDCSHACPVDAAAQKALVSTCQLPPDVGSCRASIQRFHFDPQSVSCKSFQYGGCEGNGNNFRSQSDCFLACELPLVLSSLSVNRTRSAVQGQQSALLVRSPSNRRKFGSEDWNEIDADGPDSGEDPCLLDRQVGLCRAAIKRFYFDKTAKDCKKFHYGGCGGNANNFATMKQCQQRCSQHMLEAPPSGSVSNRKSLQARPLGHLHVINPVCLQPVETGLCRALIPSYFYNSQTKSCQRFVYGGCRGNDNRFSTIEECEATCGKASRRPATTRPSSGVTNVDVVVYPKERPKCYFKGTFYNVGDVLRFSESSCRICQCLSPPDLSCMDLQCKKVVLHSTGNSDCEPVYDASNCCIQSYRCKPKAGQPSDCSRRMCVMIGFMAPPDQTCSSLSDGCCQAGMVCVSH